jgi:hypothetical protein
MYRDTGLLEIEVPTNDPWTCLYFSVVTWTTLGYGDIRPVGFARFIAGSEAIVGYFGMAALIGIFSNFFNRLDVRSKEALKSQESDGYGG